MYCVRYWRYNNGQFEKVSQAHHTQNSFPKKFVKVLMISTVVSKIISPFHFGKQEH